MTDKSAKVVVYGEPRHAWLDWLRAVSILMVLATHYQVDWRYAGLFKPLAMASMRLGWAGVDFFFVISGFLIGNLLLGEILKYGKLDAARFYFRRILKIWPLYYLMCLLYVALSPILWMQDSATGARLILPALFHIQNYVTPLAMGHTWSLAVEEHFYVLLPIVIVLCHRYSGAGRFARNLRVAIVSGIVFIVAMRTFVSLAYHVNSAEIRPYSHLRIDSMLVGVLLAWTYRFAPTLWKRLQDNPALLIAPLVVGMIPFAFNPNQSYFVATVGYTMVTFAFGAILVFSSTFERNWTGVGNGRILRSLAWIGRYSYPIYLFHPFLWRVADDFYGYPAFVARQPDLFIRSGLWLAGFVTFLALSIALGAAIGGLLEKPMLAMRNRIIPARTLAFETVAVDAAPTAPERVHAVSQTVERTSA